GPSADHRLGPGQFGQCDEGALAAQRAGHPLPPHRCRWRVRPHAGCRVCGDEPERHGADPGDAAWLRALGEPCDPPLPLPHPAGGQRLLSGGAGSPGRCRALDGLDPRLDERADAGDLLDLGADAGGAARPRRGGGGTGGGGAALAHRRCGARGTGPHRRRLRPRRHRARRLPASLVPAADRAAGAAAAARLVRPAAGTDALSHAGRGAAEL
ncbi:MAG: Uncharacterized glutathione S-transferase-like protein, partial [uncultured Craurococcus sp.]